MELAHDMALAMQEPMDRKLAQNQLQKNLFANAEAAELHQEASMLRKVHMNKTTVQSVARTLKTDIPPDFTRNDMANLAGIIGDSSHSVLW